MSGSKFGIDRALRQQARKSLDAFLSNAYKAHRWTSSRKRTTSILRHYDTLCLLNTSETTASYRPYQNDIVSLPEHLHSSCLPGSTETKVGELAACT